MRAPEPAQCGRGAGLGVAEVEHGQLEHVVFRIEDVVNDREGGVVLTCFGQERLAAPLDVGGPPAAQHETEVAPPRASSRTTPTAAATRSRSRVAYWRPLAG
jgi:hypothetical protein